MSDLRVTRELERWAGHQRRAVVLREAFLAGAIVLACASLGLGLGLWLPELRFLVLLCALVAATAIGVAIWRARSTVDARTVARALDAGAETFGLLATALAVEGRRAVGGDLPMQVVADEAAALLPHLEARARPPFELPLSAILIATMAVLFGAVVVALALVAPVLPVGPGVSSLPTVPVGLRDGVRDDLVRAVEDLQRLALEPGLDPGAKAAVERARDSARAGLAHLSDARAAAGDLDRARAAIDRAQTGPYRSTAALGAARADAVADHLDRSLQSGDIAGARRMTEEVLRRVESERSEGELRRLGRALGERPRPPGAAGHAMERAGQALAAGDRGGTLAALADVLAELGEPVRYEERPEELRTAAEAIERARRRALADLEQAEARAAAEELPSDLIPDEPAGDTTPLPFDAPDRGGEGDGGGGKAAGGTEDLLQGGTPSPGEPSIQADADSEGERAQGEGLGERFAPGEGPAEAETDLVGEAGQGDGTAQGLARPDARAASDPPPSGAGSAGGGPISGQPGGQGEGTGAGVEMPLLDLDPSLIPAEWVGSRWSADSDDRGERSAAERAEGRSALPWDEVHRRYREIAESASRREAVPLSRRRYIESYFTAIRPNETAETP